MNDAELSAFEKSRIEEILRVASLGEWENFKALTDEPFSKESSMREQFNDSSKRLKKTGGNWRKSEEFRTLDDGTRLIFVKVTSPATKDLNLLLTLHSFSDVFVSKISIWNFFQQLDLQSLLDS